MQALQQLIRAPRLWQSDPHKERRVTWMELFFDLIFVAAVAQVGKSLASDYSWAGLLRYSFLFVLIWLAWSGHTLFATRFDTDDLVQRLLTLLQSFIAAVMAANSKEPLDSVEAAGFGAAYAGLRIVLVLQYLRARHVASTRELTTRFAIGYAVAALVWIVSALTPVPARYGVWAIALAIDLGVPLLVAGHSARFPPDAAHFPERFGLFTIILLGEFVAAVMHGIESQELWSVSAASTAFMSMAFAFVVWWWYFDGAKASAERHVRTNRQLVRFRIWNYAHLPLFVGIGVAGVGFEHTIGLQSDDRMHGSQVWILCAACATLMAALIAIGASSEKAREGRRIWIQCGVLVLVAPLAALAGGTDRVALVFGLLAACLCLTVIAQRAESV